MFRTIDNVMVMNRGNTHLNTIKTGTLKTAHVRSRPGGAVERRPRAARVPLGWNNDVNDNTNKVNTINNIATTSTMYYY